jgi:hypothetical protein
VSLLANDAEISGQRRSIVGESLLAKATCLSHQLRLTHRIRQQAGSLYLDFVFSEGKVLD